MVLHKQLVYVHQKLVIAITNINIYMEEMAQMSALCYKYLLYVSKYVNRATFPYNYKRSINDIFILT
jgi:hypothetical protein